MNKKRLFHFNSCVYNVIVSGEENNQKATSVMKQKNNTLVFSDIHLHTVKAVPREYFQDLSKNKNIKVFALYPWIKETDMPTIEKEFIEYYGTMLETNSKDVDIENHEYTSVEAHILIPLTDRYMCDTSVSYVPESAVLHAGNKGIQSTDNIFANMHITPDMVSSVLADGEYEEYMKLGKYMYDNKITPNQYFEQLKNNKIEAVCSLNEMHYSDIQTRLNRLLKEKMEERVNQVN